MANSVNALKSRYEHALLEAQEAEKRLAALKHQHKNTVALRKSAYKAKTATRDDLQRSCTAHSLRMPSLRYAATAAVGGDADADDFDEEEQAEAQVEEDAGQAGPADALPAPLQQLRTTAENAGREWRRLKNAEKALGLDVKNASAEHEQKAAAKARAKAALTGAVEQADGGGGAGTGPQRAAGAVGDVEVVDADDDTPSHAQDATCPACGHKNCGRAPKSKGITETADYAVCKCKSTSCADDKCHFCKDISDLLMYKGPERAKVCLEEDCCELCACNCGASGKPFKFKNPAACVAFAAEQREADKLSKALADRLGVRRLTDAAQGRVDEAGPQAIAAVIQHGKKLSIISNNQTGQPFDVSGSGSGSEQATSLAQDAYDNSRNLGGEPFGHLKCLFDDEATEPSVRELARQRLAALLRSDAPAVLGGLRTLNPSGAGAKTANRQRGTHAAQHASTSLARAYGQAANDPKSLQGSSAVDPVRYLQEIFPMTPASGLVAALRTCNGDVNAAVDMLSGCDGPLVPASGASSAWGGREPGATALLLMQQQQQQAAQQAAQSQMMMLMMMQQQQQQQQAGGMGGLGALLAVLAGQQAGGMGGLSGALASLAAFAGPQPGGLAGGGLAGHTGAAGGTHGAVGGGLMGMLGGCGMAGPMGAMGGMPGAGAMGGLMGLPGGGGVPGLPPAAAWGQAGQALDRDSSAGAAGSTSRAHGPVLVSQLGLLGDPDSQTASNALLAGGAGQGSAGWSMHPPLHGIPREPVATAAPYRHTAADAAATYDGGGGEEAFRVAASFGSGIPLRGADAHHAGGTAGMDDEPVDLAGKAQFTGL